MAAMTRADWPVLRRYDGDHLAKIALPLGGIGTGTVSIGGRGDLRDWEVRNRPAKGFTPERAFFALYARGPEDGGAAAVARALEGPLDLALYEGGFGSPARNHGLPRFRECAFAAAYPLGQVLLSDPDVPVAARLEAFNPLVPGDPDRSGLPVAVLRWVLTNTSAAPLTVAVCGSVGSFLKGANVARTAGGVRGVLLRPGDDVAPESEDWGTLALTVLDPNSNADNGAAVTHRTAWADLSWGDSLLDFWDDFSADGRLEERESAKPGATASLAVGDLRLAPGESRAVTFLLAWHFPNRRTWTPAPPDAAAGADCGCAADGGACGDPDWVGNYYAGRYRDAWDAAVRTAADLPALEADTVAFVRAFCDADLPDAVKEAALFNLSTLRTQTCFRTPDGFLLGWEGCGDQSGCCHGSCTHVWNYEVTTPLLFGGLSRGMRDVEFLHATRDDGHMAFRVSLPLGRAPRVLAGGREGSVAAADGQMGCLMKLYRDWRLSGDDAWLRRLWPRAKAALEYCWVPGGWDADRDGVMEGCQHNTMDVEYYGPNPQMGTWYLGALRACEEMARHLGENGFAAGCRRLFESGSAWTDAHLFNGEYYEHEVRPPADPGAVAPGLRHGAGAEDLSDPDLQLGAGCLIDQLVGQYMAHVCGLGYLLKPENVRTTLRSILKYNLRRGLWGHFNHLRTFVLGDETAVLMASYPRGRRPRRPFPYYNEVMTGFEHQLAAHLLYEGMTDEGLEVVAAIRARYDGRKRSPFDEAECGHHYARAMAAWAELLALTGFRWDAAAGEMTFARSDGPATWFWSDGAAWGTVRQTPAPGGGARVELRVLGGDLAVRRLTLAGLGSADRDDPAPLRAGGAAAWTVTGPRGTPGV